MSRRGVVILLLVIFAPGFALADQPWTFCVARDLDGGAVWLSAVFATDANHETLEAAFKAYVARYRAHRLNAQCPLPKIDHTDVVNDQFGAEEFNKQSGSKVHLIAAADFPPRR